MPLKQRGAATIRWERWKESQRQIVQRRAHSHCEGCGDNMKPLELAHLVGRNNKGIGEPWASSAELTAALCSGKWDELGCHEKIDRALDPARLKVLRVDALLRLCQSYDLGVSEVIGSNQNPLDAIREAVRRLEADGWGYDADRNQVVKS